MLSNNPIVGCFSVLCFIFAIVEHIIEGIAEYMLSASNIPPLLSFMLSIPSINIIEVNIEIIPKVNPVIAKVCLG